MERAKAIAVDVTEQLSVSEILSYFKKGNKRPCYPPVRPKAGEVYLIVPKDESCKSEFIIDYPRPWAEGIVVCLCVCVCVLVSVLPQNCCLNSIITKSKQVAGLKLGNLR